MRIVSSLAWLPVALPMVVAAQTVRKAQPVPDEVLVEGDSVEKRRKAYAALSSAEGAVRKDPYDRRAIAAKSAALCEAGRAREAVDYLMDLKGQYLDFFPHQLALADAFAAARMFEDAAVAYKVVIEENGYTPEEKRAASERSRNMGRDQKLIAGEHAVRTNNETAARRALTELKGDAGHPDVIALRASVLIKERRYDEARALLDKVAATGWNSRSMAEARLALARKEVSTGAWGPAARDFGVAEEDANLTKKERHDAARMNREMLARVAPTVRYEVRGTSEHEGTLWTSGIELSTGAFGDGRNIVFLRGIWDEIGLGHQKLITQDDVDRYQAELAWRRLTRRGFYGEVTAGGGDQGGMFGGAVGRYDQPGPGWELRLRTNERAVDSLLLMALGGTQDKVSFTYRHRFTERWYLDATLGWRRVEIESNEIAEGVNLDFRLVYTLLEEGDGRPGVTVGYFAEVQALDRKRLPDDLLCEVLRYARRQHDPLDALIDDRINRHGLVVTATKQFGARWSGFVYGGVAYEFEEGRTEGLAGAGMTAYLNRNTTLIFSMNYSTSGNAANKGEDVVTGMVRVRVSF